MAATSFDAVAALSSTDKAIDPAAAPSFVFEIYDDDAARPTTNDAQLVPRPSQQQQQQQQRHQQQEQQQQQLSASLPSSLSALPLPGGACNYVDLNHGSSGAQCGCRRFWSRSNSIFATPGTPSFGAIQPAGNINGSLAELNASQAGWCMCSHHACFHDHGPNNSSMSDRVSISTSFFTTGIAPAAASASLLGKPSSPRALLPLSSAPVSDRENGPSRSSRTPFSPVLDSREDHVSRRQMDRDEPSLPDISFGFPSDVPVQLNSSFVAMIHDAARESRDLIMAAAETEAAEDEVPTEDEEAGADVITTTSPPPEHHPPAAAAAAVSVAGSHTEHSIPDTLSWGPYGMSARGEAPASVAGSISATNHHPGPILSQQPPPSVTTTTSYTSQMRYMRPFAGRGLQTLNQAQPTSAPALSSDSPAAALFEQEPGSTSSSRPLGLGSLTNAVQSHEARLNKLENPSFCASTASVSASFAATQAHEECIERHDHMDMRVTELESRLGEVERNQMNNDNDTATVTASSITSISASGAPLSTTASMLSRAAMITATDPAILSQIKALQEHVSLLQQAALPSPSRPWQIEVVFMPFPLKGIWVEAGQFGPAEVVASAAAAQRRQRGTTPSNGDADGEDEWMQTSWRSDTPRLLPRACMPGRDIERRLRSRGLIQTVTVRGADAHSLHMAMVAAFGPLLRTLSSNNTTPSAAAAAAEADKGHRRSSSVALVSQFLGLQQSWVPLRKVHKESRLRLLKRSEMLTPAVWDVSFMTASVVMKASGLHRLFVTQPGAYLQNRDAYIHGWSWQRLRELPQVQVELENGTRGIDDACWAWNSKLDEPPAASTSQSASSSLSSSSSLLSSSSPPLLTSSRLHRPSPSPFSRESTPTGRTRLHRASYPSLAAAAAAAETTATTMVAAINPSAPAGRSFSMSLDNSGGTSGSSDQFFTVAQSPMHHRLQQQHFLQQTEPGTGVPAASTTLRRSLSPFFSSSSPLVTRRVPPPIQTTLMPAQPRMASPIMIRGASSGAANRNRRHNHSAGSNHAPAPAAVTPAPPLSGGINKRSRRRSTRSPSFGGMWPRNTPRYSRSRSVTPAPGWATTEEHQSRQRQHQQHHHEYQNQNQHQHQYQRQAAPQRVRGTTPFAYATPFSTGADHFPPTSASSMVSASGGGGSRRKRQRRERLERQERQLQYRRNSRHGSRGPMPAVFGHVNNGQNYYDDQDMMMVGYDSDDIDDFDFPMTQDEDDEDGDDDDEDDDDNAGGDIEVYEDEQDMLGFSSNDGHYQPHRSERPLLPKDQPQPGIEFDGDDDNAVDDDEDDEDNEDIEDDEDDEDDGEDFIGHTFGSRRHHASTRNTHDDEDESMSDSENMDPLPISLFGDHNGEDGQSQQQQQPQQQSLQGATAQQQQQKEDNGEDNHSDHSSQPSEYPSTRRPWRLGPVSAAVFASGGGHGTEGRKHTADEAGIGFKIHEDGDALNS